MVTSKKVSWGRLGAAFVVVLSFVVGGGVVARAKASVSASASGSITACVHKKTKVMRLVKKCKKSETKVTWNILGATGATGATGAKGDAGAAGAAGATGAKGDSGAAGGTRITELSVCDGSDAGTVADELCKIGMTGPGGGPVFFIDYQDQFTTFCAGGVDCNYLEASPADIDESGGDFTSAWCSNTSSLQNFDTWQYGAIGAGRANTMSLDITCTSGAVQAASDYTSPAFNGATKGDWWLPSIGELTTMYLNLRSAGVGSFAADCYWSSSESSATLAWVQYFTFGNPDGNFNKTATYRVRPVRGF